jgi:hypothetical protein
MNLPFFKDRIGKPLKAKIREENLRRKSIGGGKDWRVCSRRKPDPILLWNRCKLASACEFAFDGGIRQKGYTLALNFV